jgi:hypothetical protein
MTAGRSAQRCSVGDVTKPPYDTTVDDFEGPPAGALACSPGALEDTCQDTADLWN